MLSSDSRVISSDNALLSEPIQIRGSGINKRGFIFEHLGDARDLSIGLLPAALLDSLTNAGHGLRSVSGVNAGSINHVPVPGAAGKTGGIGESALASQQRLV